MKKIPEVSPENRRLENLLEHVTAFLAQDETPRKPSELTDSRLEQNLLFAISRHRATLDWLISQNATGKVRPRTRRVLYWALAEFLYFNGVPRHAVTDAATSFVKSRHAASEAGFVNALLRKLSARLEAGENLMDKAPQHIQLDLPQELWQRWKKNLGPQKTREVAGQMLVPASLTFRLSLWPQVDQPVTELLEPLTPVTWLPQARLFTPREKIERLGPFMAEHPELYIQDPATLLAPAMMKPVPEEDIADFCAAPGGKARLIAELTQNRARLICRDKTPDKLEKLRQNLKDYTCTIQQADATDPHLPDASLDAVLLDVPCTNTGVLRHKPDAKWSFSTKKLNELVQLQKTILDAAAPLVRPGGRIVYSTCSIEPEENALQVQSFLERHQDFTLGGQEQLLPEASHDGAFAAVLFKQ